MKGDMIKKYLDSDNDHDLRRASCTVGSSLMER